MARHAADLSSLNVLIEQKGIKCGMNSNLILNKENNVTLFNSQQQVLNISLHACDVSTATRPFEIQTQWANLLFEEFWNQGDLEKS